MRDRLLPGWFVLLPAALLVSALGYGIDSIAACDDEHSSTQTLAQVRQLSDEQLAERLAELLGGDFPETSEYDAYLSEIVARGKERSKAFLRTHLNALSARTLNQPEVLLGANREPGTYFNLELLTALRRLQKEPDPLTIEVELDGTQLTATPLSLPRFKVAIKNVDSGKEDAGFTFGGDYRSGRQDRWRVQVMDENGREVPLKQRYGMIMAGGQYQTGVLKHGESWKTVI